MGNTACFRCGSTTALRLGDVLPGLCDACLDTLLLTGGWELNDLLESSDMPVALVGNDMTVLAFNSRFEQVFRKFDGEIGGMKIGEIVDCAVATPSEACGLTHLCLHCGIKRLVDITRISGERLSRIPMSFRHKSGLEQTYVFTTDKRGLTTLVTIGT
jgi:hypothetical protein